MAATMVARSGLSDVETLAHVIADEEGVGIKLARVLAELQYDELATYAISWDRAAACEKSEKSEKRSASCPVCGSPIVGQQCYVGGRGHLFFEVCAGDGSHYC